MKEKAKHVRPRINRLSFVLLWVVLSTGLAAISHEIFLWLMEQLRQTINIEVLAENLWRWVLLESFLFVVLTAPVKKILLKLAFGQWIRGWISAELLSMVISLMPYIVLQSLGLQSFGLNNLQNSAVIVITSYIAALPQVWVLRRYVQNSWQYMIAAVMSAFIPVLLVSQMQAMPLGASFTIGLSSAVTALTMLWLFAHPKNEEKAKRAEAETYKRLEDGAEEGETEIEEKSEKEKSMKRRSLNSFMLYQILRLNFWKTWQKT